MNRPHMKEKDSVRGTKLPANSASFLCFVLCVVLLCLVVPNAKGQTCIGRATGVPAAAGPPNWWDSIPPQPVYAHKLDDPRWTGSSAITYGNGTANQAIFRVGHDTNNLYLSWRVTVAPAVTANQNALYFGFQRSAAAGGGDAIVRVTLQNLASSEAVASGSGAFALDAFLRNSADGKQGATISPGWLGETRVWVNNPTANSFAVQMRIPLSEFSANAAGEFKMWYEVLVGTPSAPIYTPMVWPRTGGVVITEGGFPVDKIYPDPVNWELFKVDTAGCTPGGVSIAAFNIGTTNSPSSFIRYDKIATNPQPVNTFYARPTNDTGGTIATGTLLATFRIANWGSLPNWEDGVPIGTLWQVIPGGADRPNIANISTGTTATATNESHFDWQLGAADIAAFEGGTRRKHQCMLVELKDTVGLTYRNNSVYRNMDFVGASTFTREAEVSILGLTPFSPQGRDVYIYVETLNMPAKIDPGQGPGKLPPNMTTGAVVGSGQIPTPEQLQQMVAEGRVTQEQLDQVVPTYRIHVFHDTGQKLTVGGTQRPVLKAQGSFGYYVSHQGALTGWKHEVTSDDVTLDQIAPNFYRVRNVPNNGKFSVKTTIEAVEPKPPSQNRFGLSLHAGTNIPHGNFGKVFDPGFSFTADLEYRVNNNFSVEGLFGYNRFRGGTLNAICPPSVPACVPNIKVPDLNLYNVSVNGKFYFAGTNTRPFVNFGGGVYKFDPGITRGGGNFGFGLQRNVTSHFALEGAYNFHTVATPGSATNFSTLQFGIRVRP